MVIGIGYLSMNGQYISISPKKPTSVDLLMYSLQAPESRLWCILQFKT